MADLETTNGPRRTTDRDVTASELGTYAFCAKAWHLERVLGKRPSGDAARRRVEGIDHHEAHGARVSRLQRLGRRWLWGSVILLLLALVLLVLAIAWR